MIKFKLVEQEEQNLDHYGSLIHSKPIKNKQIKFYLLGGEGNFTINALDDLGKRIGYINLIISKNLSEPTYTVKYVTVNPEYRKSEGDADSVAKYLYNLAKIKAKEFGGQYLGSDSRLSPDSHRNWFAKRQKDPNEVGVVDDPKAKPGKKYTDSELEKGPKQRYRIRLEMKTRKKEK